MATSPRLNKFVDTLRSAFNFFGLLNKAFAAEDNRSERFNTDLLFQIAHPDSVNVSLKVSVLYTINKCDEDAINNDPFREINEQHLRQTLADTMEENLSQFFSRQSLTHAVNLKDETVDHINLPVRRVLHSWGYKLSEIKIQEFEVTDPNNLTVLSVIEVTPLPVQTESLETENPAALVDADVDVLISRLGNQGNTIFGDDISIGVSRQATN